MAKRSGLSISVKMILTSTMLVLVAVMGLSIVSILHERAVHGTATEREDSDGLNRRGHTNARMVAAALAAWHGPEAGPESEPEPGRRDEAGLAQTLADLLAADGDGVRLGHARMGDMTAVVSCAPDPGATVVCTADDPHGQAAWARVMRYRRQAHGDDPNAGDVTLRLDRGVVDDSADGVLFTHDIVAATRPGTRSGMRSGAGTGLAHGDAAPVGEVALVYSVDGSGSEGLAFAGYQAQAGEHNNGQAGDDTNDQLVLRLVALGVFFVLLGLVLSTLSARRLTSALHALSEKAALIAGGDLDVRAEVSSNDEMGRLGDNFNQMVEHFSVLVQETRTRVTLEKELAVARTIQETLVPPNDPVDWGCFSFAGYFQPASECGGDWWTYHGLKDGKLLLLIGDATGHGFPSAMITATAKASCDVARSMHDDQVTVSAMLSVMNNAIYQSARRRFVMTCFAAIICPESRVITYANAGHKFPYLFRVGEDGRGEFGSLMIRGNRLGDLKESQYECRTTQLRPGDTLIWYTDGVVEGENAGGEEYGEKRFRSSIRRAAHLDAGDLRNTVVSDLTNFFGKAQRKDDITMIVGRVS